METNDSPHPVAPRSGKWGMILLACGLIVALAGDGYLLWRVGRMDEDFTKSREASDVENTDLRQQLAASTARQAQLQEQAIDTFRTDLGAARREASQSAAKVKSEALKHSEEVAQRLAEQQQQQQQQVAMELTGVKESAATANAKIVEVSTEVAAAKTEIDKTIADLKRVTGDMGIMSGLIATNGKELAALKELGERNYFEFQLTRSKRPQAVGDIRMVLKRTDPKRNRFTVDVLADDKNVEKKDRHINEPVQFYTSQSRLPYEIVVNEVKKDQILGYLATPKVTLARR